MPEHPFGRLVVPANQYAAMVAAAKTEAPLECCGFLAGRIQGGAGYVEGIYPLINEAASPTEFISEARSTFDAMRDMDRRELAVLAVYHSHPASLPVPSKKDLEWNYSPDVINVIVSLQTEPPLVGAWWLRDREFEWAVFVTSSFPPCR